jgi:hypothetical protein
MLGTAAGSNDNAKTIASNTAKSLFTFISILSLIYSTMALKALLACNMPVGSIS